MTYNVSIWKQKVMANMENTKYFIKESSIIEH